MLYHTYIDHYTVLAYKYHILEMYLEYVFEPCNVLIFVLLHIAFRESVRYLTYQVTDKIKEQNNHGLSIVNICYTHVDILSRYQC